MRAVVELMLPLLRLGVRGSMPIESRATNFRRPTVTLAIADRRTATERSTKHGQNAASKVSQRTRLPTWSLNRT